MVTVFCVPKAFQGPMATIQQNALRSWARLRPACQILVFGNDPGVAQAAVECGVQHCATVARNDFGTPLLSDVFAQAEQSAQHELLCYVNADIILLNDFMEAVRRVREWTRHFLVIGECWNLDVTEPLSFDQSDWEAGLRQSVQQHGQRRGKTALDFFVFPRGLYQRWLPLALGRAAFDNWLVWEARAMGQPVVDIGGVATVIHQNHDYAHVAGGRRWSHTGAEAIGNRALAGGKRRLYYLADATHKLCPNGVKRRLMHHGRLEHWLLRAGKHFGR